MKIVLLLLMMLPLAGFAQKYVLLDRDFIRPVIVTDEVTAGQMHKRRFPVFTKDIDSLIHFTERLQKQMNTRITYETASGYYPVGGSWFVAHREKTGKINKYNITLNTRVNDIGASLELVSNSNGSKTALQKINIFLDYLRNNRVLIKDAAMHTP
jgi:hypothetical protein